MTLRLMGNIPSLHVPEDVKEYLAKAMVPITVVTLAAICSFAGVPLRGVEGRASPAFVDDPTCKSMAITALETAAMVIGVFGLGVAAYFNNRQTKGLRQEGLHPEILRPQVRNRAANQWDRLSPRSLN